MHRTIIIAIIFLLGINILLGYIAMRKYYSTKTESPTTLKKTYTSLTQMKQISPIPANLESCFIYYDYDKVDIHLTSHKSVYDSNKDSQINLIGSIVNKNSRPLTNITIDAQIRKINTKTHQKNGHYLIDIVRIAENIYMQPDESINITKTIPLISNYPDGEYQIQYYIYSPGGFHYAGRSFLEEDYAGTTQFSISGNQRLLPYFNIDTSQVNNQTVNLRDMIHIYPQGPLTFTFPLNNLDTNNQNISATVTIYYFENDQKENQIEEKQIPVINNAITYTFNAPIRGAYVIVAKLNNDYKSLIKYRFASEHTILSDIRLNDMGVSSFPANTETKGWVCFHSPDNGYSPETEITLSLFNNKNEIIHTTSLSQSFSPDVQAISIPFNNLNSPEDFFLETVIINKKESREIARHKIHYNCEYFKNSISFIKLHYLNSSSSIQIKPYNSCNKLISADIFLDSLIIKNEQKSFKEETNITYKNNTINISDLPKDKYTVSIKSGRFTGTLSINTETNQTSIDQSVQKKNPRVIVFISFFIIVVGVLASIIVIKQGKNHD